MRGRIRETAVVLDHYRGLRFADCARRLGADPGRRPESQGQGQAATADDGQLDSGVLNLRDIFAVTVEGIGKLTYRWCCTRIKGSIAIGAPAAAGDATAEESARSTHTVSDWRLAGS